MQKHLSGEVKTLAVPSPCVSLGECCPFINLNNHPSLPHGVWEKLDMNAPSPSEVKGLWSIPNSQQKQMASQNWSCYQVS